MHVYQLTKIQTIKTSRCIGNRSEIMKKIFLILMTLLSCQLSIAQLQIESSGKAKSASEYQKDATHIVKLEDGYYYGCLDYECTKYNLYGKQYIVYLYLGDNAAEIQQSANTLKSWFEGAKNDEYIYVTNPNGQKVCIYKFNANMYCSYGTDAHCKATRLKYGADMTAALTGLSYKSKEGRDVLMGNIEFGEHKLTTFFGFKKEFLKEASAFKDPGQVNEEYKKEIIAELPKIKKLYSDKGLLESVVYTTYKEYANQKINSTLEEDWKNLAQIQTLLVSLVKGKHTISIESIESELNAVETIEERVALLLNY